MRQMHTSPIPITNGVQTATETLPGLTGRIEMRHMHRASECLSVTSRTKPLHQNAEVLFTNPKSAWMSSRTLMQVSAARGGGRCSSGVSYGMLLRNGGRTRGRSGAPMDRRRRAMQMYRHGDEWTIVTTRYTARLTTGVPALAIAREGVPLLRMPLAAGLGVPDQDERLDDIRVTELREVSPGELIFRAAARSSLWEAHTFVWTLRD